MNVYFIRYFLSHCNQYYKLVIANSFDDAVEKLKTHLGNEWNESTFINETVI